LKTFLRKWPQDDRSLIIQAMLEKIISGGQTGVDRAGLDAAMEAGIAVGGSCPRGRLAEDGPIPSKYPLTEMDECSYSARTEQNVVDSDGTLVLNLDGLSGGTAETVKFAAKHTRPCLLLKLEDDPQPEAVLRWLGERGIRVLNVAGPRESKSPRGAYRQALELLRRVFGVNS